MADTLDPLRLAKETAKAMKDIDKAAGRMGQTFHNLAKDIQDSVSDLQDKLDDMPGVNKFKNELKDASQRVMELSKGIKLTGSDTKKWNKSLSSATDIMSELNKYQFMMNDEEKEYIQNLEKRLKKIEILRKNYQAMAVAGKYIDVDKVGSMFDTMADKARKIPVIGHMISKSFANAADNAQKSFINKMGKIGAENVTFFNAMGARMSSVFAAGWAAAVAVAIYALYKLLEGVWERLVALNKASMEFAKNTGATNQQLKDMRGLIVGAYTGLAQFGVTAEIAGQSATALYNAFQGSKRVTATLVETTSLMVSNLQMSADEAAGVLKTFMATANYTDQQAANLAGSVAHAADLAGVSPKAILADMAKSARAINLFFRGNVKAAAAQTIQLQRMGTTLEKAAKSAESLLEWDTSIEAEMEASVMLGRQINLQNARWMAWNGDIEGSQKEILNQVGSLNEFNAMNLLQKKALAKAAGMEVEELGTVLKQTEDLSKLTPAQTDEYEAALAELKAIGEQQKDLIKDVRTQVETQKLAQAWERIYAILVGLLVPILEKYVLPAVEAIAGWMNSIGVGTEKAAKTTEQLKVQAAGIVPYFEAAWSVLKAVWSVLQTIYESAPIQALITWWKFLIDTISWFVKTPFFDYLIKGLNIVIKILGYVLLPIIIAVGVAFAAAWIAATWPVLAVIAAIVAVVAAIGWLWDNWETIWQGMTAWVTGLWKAIVGFIGVIFNLGYAIGTAIKGGIQSAIDWVKSSLADLGKWVSNIPIIGPLIKGLTSVAGAIGGAIGGVLGLAEGGIVTRPTMAIVGEAGPEAVVPLGANAPAGIPTMSNADVVKKLDELISVMRTGFGVYMDGTKVGDAILRNSVSPAMSNAV